MVINQGTARVSGVVNPAPVSATSAGMAVLWLAITASLLLLPNLTKEHPKFFLINTSPHHPQCTDREGTHGTHATHGWNGCTWFEVEPKDQRRCTDVDGNTREPGDSWKDDCNTCHCTQTGNVGCTKMLCAPKDLNTSKRQDPFGDYCWLCYNGGFGK